MNIYAQVFGFIAIGLWVFSIQKNSKKDILFFQTGANLFYIIMYLILGAYTGASMNFISASKGLIFYEYEKQKRIIPKYLLIIFLVAITILGFITWSSFLSLIPMVAAILYIVSTWQKDLKVIRVVYIIAAIAWIYYNYITGAYIGVFGNILEIISGILSLNKNKNQLGKKEAV